MGVYGNVTDGADATVEDDVDNALLEIAAQYTLDDQFLEITNDSETLTSSPQHHR